MRAILWLSAAPQPALQYSCVGTSAASVAQSSTARRRPAGSAEALPGKKMRPLVHLSVRAPPPRGKLTRCRGVRGAPAAVALGLALGLELCSAQCW